MQVWVACGAAKVNTINHDVDERAREREREIFSIYIYIYHIYIYIFQSSTAKRTAFFMHSRAADLDWVPPPPASQRQQPPILALRPSTCPQAENSTSATAETSQAPFPHQGGDGKGAQTATSASG